MRLLFGGDFLCEGHECPDIENDDITSAIESADEFILNLEGPIIGKHISPINKVGPVKCQSNIVPNILKNFNVSTVTLANNHIMDYGVSGTKSTVKELKKNDLNFFGLTGVNSKNGIFRTTINGFNLSFISLAEEEFNSVGEFNDVGALIIDPLNLWYIISEEFNISDKIIVILHGGVEHEHCPPPWLRRISHWLIDMGISAVVTHHPHVPGGVEVYKDVPIAWSLGNFWFSDGGGNRFWNHIGYLFELVISNEGNIDWNILPYFLDYDKKKISKLKNGDLYKWKFLQNNLYKIFNDNELYDQWWHELIENKYLNYQFKYSFAPMPRVIGILINRLMSFFKGDYRWNLRQLNGLRCESHKNLWIGALMESRDKNGNNK